MTFLEVVFASAILAVIAAGLFGVFSFVLGVQSRDRQRLMAMEVANRLIINFMDDKTKMPDPNKLLEYGPAEAPSKFRWQLREDPLAVAEVMADRRGAGTSGLALDRFRVVTVRVWLSEQSGGSAKPDGSTPEAVLTRMFDPVGMRNPDAINRMMTDPEVMRQLLGTISTSLAGSPQAGRPVVNRPPRGSGVAAPGSFGQRGGIRNFGPGQRQGQGQGRAPFAPGAQGPRGERPTGNPGAPR